MVPTYDFVLSFSLLPLYISVLSLFVGEFTSYFGLDLYFMWFGCGVGLFVICLFVWCGFDGGNQPLFV